MDKEKFVSKVDNISEELGAEFPNVKTTSQRVAKNTNVSLLNGIVTFINEFNQFKDFKEVQPLYEEVENFYEDNKIRLTLEWAKDMLSRSNDKLNEAALEEVFSVLEKNDDSLVNTGISKLSRFSFIPAVNETLKVLEEAKVKKQKKKAEDVDVDDELEDEDDAHLTVEVKELIKESRKGDDPKELKFLLSVANNLRANDPEIVAESVLDSLEIDQYSTPLLEELRLMCEHVVNENRFGLVLKKLINELKNSNVSKLVSKPVKVFEELAQKSEEEIKSSINETLNEWGWISEVKHANNVVSGMLNEGVNATKYSDFVKVNPVTAIERGIFKLGGSFYKVTENSIDKVDDKEVDIESKEKVDIINEALAPFTFNSTLDAFEFTSNNGSKVQLFINENSPMLKIDGETFEGEAANNLMLSVSESVLPKRVVEGIKTILNTDNVQDNIVSLDCATVIGENHDAIVINYGDTLMINEEQVEDAEELVKTVSESYGVDISTFIIERLDENRQASFYVNERFEKLSKTKEFLQEKIERVTNIIKSPDYVNENEFLALRMKLKDSLEKVEEELAKISGVHEMLKEKTWSEFINEAKEKEKEKNETYDFKNEGDVEEYINSKTEKISDDDMTDEEVKACIDECKGMYNENKHLKSEEVDKVIEKYMKKSK